MDRFYRTGAGRDARPSKVSSGTGQGRRGMPLFLLMPGDEQGLDFLPEAENHEVVSSTDDVVDFLPGNGEDRFPVAMDLDEVQVARGAVEGG